MKEIIITPAEAGQRFDKYLCKYLNTAPKSFVYKMLRKKRIKLNGNKADGSQMLADGDRVSLYLAPETMEQFMEARQVRASGGRIEIVYEDDNILLLNKLAGTLSHAGHKDDKDTLIDRVLFYLREKDEWDGGAGSTFTPSLCNRLDRNTSGIVICGKNLAAVQELHRVISARMVEKYYLTVVVGDMDKQGVLRGGYVKDKENNQAYISENCGGREAVTAYERLDRAVVKDSSDKQMVLSLLRVRLITGRSHQIRAHFHSIGHPVLGDPKYGDATINQWLREKYGIRSQLLHSEGILFQGIHAGNPVQYLNGRMFSCPMRGGFQKLAGDHFPVMRKQPETHLN